MNLIEAFDKNLIIDKKPDKIIETIISKLYFYGDKVYKIYKYEKFFFGDFGDWDFRKKFYEEDFCWNSTMAPSVYLALTGVKNTDDFFIEMKKFDDSKNLTNLLLQKKISDSDIKKIIAEMTSRLKKITDSKKKDPNYDFNKNLTDIHFADLESDSNLLRLIPSFIAKEKIEEIADFLKEASRDSAYFKNYDAKNFSILIDNHADNIVFLDGKIEFVDVLPPKESWRIGDIYFIICRLATDIAVLMQEDKAKVVYDYCRNTLAPVPEEIKRIYEIRSALIQTWCFYSVKNLEIAQKYLKFAEKKISFLKNK